MVRVTLDIVLVAFVHHHGTQCAVGYDNGTLLAAVVYVLNGILCCVLLQEWSTRLLY